MSSLPKLKNPYYVALRLLSFRQRSERELFERLRKKKFSEKKSKEVIEDLKKKKLIDDKKFARDFVLYRLEAHLEGKALLKRRLFRRKIPSGIIDEILGELFSENKELELAISAAKKKRELLKNKNLNPAEQRLKISLFLRGRGFSTEVIKEALFKIKI